MRRRPRRHFPFRRALPLVAGALALAALLSACGASSGETSGQSPSAPTPLADALGSLAPDAVWRHFWALTQLARPSGHEEAAAAYVTTWARERGLQATVDDAGNVVVRVPASQGREDAPGVVLQGHLDMVVARTATATVDPETDPLIPVVADGWVRAGGTTLGADDGIGVALVLALLEDESVAHGPIEALFTVGEEEGLIGASALAPGALQSRMLINLDDEIEGELTISSAGSLVADVTASYEEQPAPAGMAGLTVTVDGLRGGHSGTDIDKGRGSALQLIARLLTEAPATYGVRVAGVDGGDAENAIPSKATAVVALPEAQAEAFSAYVAAFGEEAATELADGDPGVTVTVTPAEAPGRVMAPPAQRALLGAVRDVPQGVYKMSDDVPGLVETSGNLGVLAISDGDFTATFMVRSAVDAERDAEAQRFAAVFEEAGATTTVDKKYPSWPPNPDSQLLALLKAAYTDTLGREPTVAAVHAGVEAGAIGAKYAGMDMVSLGPTILGGHTPEERVEVASVARVYDVLATALKQIGEQQTQ